MGALRQTATGYLEKDNLSKLLAPKKEKEETSNEQEIRRKKSAQAQKWKRLSTKS